MIRPRSARRGGAGRSFTTLDDLNRQASVWRDEVYRARHWVDDDAHTVGEALAEDRERRLLLPAHPFETDLVRAITTGKTIHFRFDLNDYSIPPGAVGHTLMLVASDALVRILDGTVEITRHRRSYGRPESIVDPRHEHALLEEKRKALGAARGGRLPAAAPATAVGLHAVSDGLDDLVARAAKGRWDARQLLAEFVHAELGEPARRGLQRRLQRSRIGRVKPIADFDWNWPQEIDRDTIEAALTLDFIKEARNLILGGTPVQLARKPPPQARALRPTRLVVHRRSRDLSYDNHAAGPLYKVVNRRYGQKALVVTTNRVFKEWNFVFPNATCIATLLDRLTHHADVTVITGESYRVWRSTSPAGRRSGRSLRRSAARRRRCASASREPVPSRSTSIGSDPRPGHPAPPWVSRTRLSWA